ncbi:hypothetical protein KM043_014987 [Ampulex compressa]|nr:hypothetical protein KM043_014987 [Ampulex compressa]
MAIAGSIRERNGTKHPGFLSLARPACMNKSGEPGPAGEDGHDERVKEICDVPIGHTGYRRAFELCSSNGVELQLCEIFLIFGQPLNL